MQSRLKNGLVISALLVLTSAFISSPIFVLAQEATPPEQICGPRAHWDSVAQRCRRNVPSVGVESTPTLRLLDPPAGVIVLRPGGVREQAMSCPAGFKEAPGLNGWRFCVDPVKPEALPPLEVPPIAGIPYEESLKIMERHSQKLAEIPGTESVGLSSEGVIIYTDNPQLAPRTVEGLPIIIRKPEKRRFRNLNHTVNKKVRPIHGAVLFRDELNPDWQYSTMTAVGLSQGEPFLIFPAHSLARCDGVPPCPASAGNPVNSTCPRNQIINGTFTTVGTQLIKQPPQSTASQRVGFV
jgi:hypothetical protein